MNRKISFVAVIIGFFFSAGFFDSALAQTKTGTQYVTLPRSRIWIEGSSTVNEFSCSTQKVDGIGYLKGKTDSTTEEANSKDSSAVDISVMVKSFDCGIGAMNDDMYKAMKSSEHPTIEYKLIRARVMMKADSLNAVKFVLDTYGDLTIAGVTNKEDILISVRGLDDGIYHLEGSKVLSMNDFDITPPSHFFGIIKAHDQLVVHFDLYAKEQTTTVGLLSSKN